LFLKVLEYKEYKSKFSKYYITTDTVRKFMDRKRPTLMKNINVNLLTVTPPFLNRHENAHFELKWL